MKHRDLTSEIIAACYEVSRELGPGFLESVYQRALVIALSDRGLAVCREVPISVYFRGQAVGEFQADILVEGCVIVELKACERLAPEHQAQLINYLNASELEVGLLVNFGTASPEIRRCSRRERSGRGG